MLAPNSKYKLTGLPSSVQKCTRRLNLFSHTLYPQRSFTETNHSYWPHCLVIHLVVDVGKSTTVHLIRKLRLSKSKLVYLASSFLSLVHFALAEVVYNSTGNVCFQMEPCIAIM
jgi:hypothetical protein